MIIPKMITRLIALILIPCLVADPVRAALVASPMAPRLVQGFSRITEEAISARPLAVNQIRTGAMVGHVEHTFSREETLNLGNRYEATKTSFQQRLESFARSINQSMQNALQATGNYPNSCTPASLAAMALLKRHFQDQIMTELWQGLYFPDGGQFILHTFLIIQERGSSQRYYLSYSDGQFHTDPGELNEEVAFYRLLKLDFVTLEALPNKNLNAFFLKKFNLRGVTRASMDDFDINRHRSRAQRIVQLVEESSDLLKDPATLPESDAPASVRFLKRVLKDGNMTEALREGKIGRRWEIASGVLMGTLSILSAIGMLPGGLIIPVFVFVAALAFFGYHLHLIREITLKTNKPFSLEGKLIQAIVLLMYALPGLVLAYTQFKDPSHFIENLVIMTSALLLAPVAHYLWDERVFEAQIVTPPLPSPLASTFIREAVYKKAAFSVAAIGFLSWMVELFNTHFEGRYSLETISSIAGQILQGIQSGEISQNPNIPVPKKWLEQVRVPMNNVDLEILSSQMHELAARFESVRSHLYMVAVDMDMDIRQGLVPNAEEEKYSLMKSSSIDLPLAEKMVSRLVRDLGGPDSLGESKSSANTELKVRPSEWDDFHLLDANARGQLFRKADKRNTSLYTVWSRDSEDLHLSPEHVFQFDEGQSWHDQQHFESYAFDAGPGWTAYRVGTGERIWMTLSEGQNGLLASTHFSSCAGVAISGRSSQGEMVLYLAHITASYPKGQASGIRDEVQKLKAAGMTGMKLYATIDPAAYGPHLGDPGDWRPAFYTFPRDLQSYLGPDITVLEVIPAALDNQGGPYTRHLYVSTKGIAIEYPGYPGLAALRLWSGADPHGENNPPTMSDHHGVGFDMVDRFTASVEDIAEREENIHHIIRSGKLPPRFAELSIKIAGIRRFSVLIHMDVLDRWRRHGMDVPAYLKHVLAMRPKTPRGSLLFALRATLKRRAENQPLLIIDGLTRSPKLYGVYGNRGYMYINVNGPALDVFGGSHEMTHVSGLYSNSLEDEEELAVQDEKILLERGFTHDALVTMLRGIVKDSSRLLRSARSDDKLLTGPVAEVDYQRLRVLAAKFASNDAINHAVRALSSTHAHRTKAFHTLIENLEVALKEWEKESSHALKSPVGQVLLHSIRYDFINAISVLNAYVVATHSTKEIKGAAEQVIASLSFAMNYLRDLPPVHIDEYETFRIRYAA